MRSATPEQQKAIAATGNVLVVAGAGAGKTRTLIERCLAWLLDDANGASVDEILMVTFTQAAATEMRQRLRTGLENSRMSPGRLAEQLALLETAHISTLHSFCFRLVSQHYYDLGLDPQLRVFSGQETELLARQTLDAVLDEIYGSEDPASLAIHQLIQTHGGDGDQPVRDTILRLHQYSRTLRDPAAWLSTQLAHFRKPDPEEWRRWFMDALHDRRKAWLHALQSQLPGNPNAALCAKALNALPSNPAQDDFAMALKLILQADTNWPKGKKTSLRAPLQEIFEEAAFLYSLCRAGNNDPLAEDWNWVRDQMLALLDAAVRFQEAFAKAKRQGGGIDFQDLEQFALKLLWHGDRPSPIALRWREKIRLVFVDEFQDINRAQEAIVEALSREGAAANRFLVGDVKQSIYRFRLADPGIFINYKSQWEKEADSGQVLGLSENFRSHEAILNFINALFAPLMRESLGGVAYDTADQLRFGAPVLRAALARRNGNPPPVELHIRRSAAGNQDQEIGIGSEAEKEARLVCRRLMELKQENVPIIDGEARRPMTWRDIVILLRTPRGKAAAYVKEFSRLGVPLVAQTGGFLDGAEARDLLALLQLLDNPLQDLPLLAVLLSPLVGMTPASLAEIRIAHPQGRFWTALVDWQRDAEKKDPATAARAGLFLRRYRDWRRLSRRAPVSQCLEKIIDDTHYADLAAARDRGDQRRGNVERFLHLARQFEAGRGESLSRFINFLEKHQESDIDIEPAAAPEADAVRLMSIHQSKGLEFPVVVVADLGKRFNFNDLRRRIILDDKYGLCPLIKPPDSAQFYPSLPHWLAECRQRREILGEEMRLLYVAVTRAAQRLILAGAASNTSLDERWSARAKAGLGDVEILSGSSYVDWIGTWLALTAAPSASGANSLLTWTVYDEETSSETLVSPLVSAPDELDITPEIRRRLDWQYPHNAETELPAKTSVSLLRREISGLEDDEASRLFAFDPTSVRRANTGGRLTSAEIGSAHHSFLQLVSLDRSQSVDELRAEAERLRLSEKLTPDEAACLDFEGLAAFWRSDVGRQLIGVSGSIRRELAFTTRFAPAELARLGCGEYAAAAPEEFVVVQGAVDLAAFLPGEIWLLDFKTDRFRAGELNEKIEMYRPQLALYAQALARISQRPVTRRWLHFLACRQTAELH